MVSRIANRPKQEVRVALVWGRGKTHLPEKSSGGDTVAGSDGFSRVGSICGAVLDGFHWKDLT